MAVTVKRTYHDERYREGKRDVATVAERNKVDETLARARVVNIDIYLSTPWHTR